MGSAPRVARRAGPGGAGRAPPHLCAAFRSSSSWLSFRRFSSSLTKFSFCTTSQVTTFWSRGSGRSLSGEAGQPQGRAQAWKPPGGQALWAAAEGAGARRLLPPAPTQAQGPSMRSPGRSLTQARPLLRGPPPQEPLEHQAQVAEEDERGRQRGALVVLHDEVEALGLPEGVRIALHRLERVAADSSGQAGGVGTQPCAPPRPAPPPGLPATPLLQPGRPRHLPTHPYRACTTCSVP